MGNESFFSFLSETSRKNNSVLCVGVDPRPDVTSTADLMSFANWLLEATKESVCAYMLDSALYEARGMGGLAALRTIVDDIHAAGFPVILDAKRGDISSSSAAYARAAFEAWGADAVTVNPLLGSDSMESFSARADHGVFVLCHASNPGAGDFLELKEEGTTVFERIANLVESWNTRGNMGLMLDVDSPDAIERVRRIAPNMWFLLSGVEGRVALLEQSVRSAVINDSSPVLVAMVRNISTSPSPRAAALEYRDRINEARASQRTAGKAAAVAPLVSDSLREDVALGLHALGAVNYGRVTLKPGSEFPVSIDLGLLVSDPKLMALVARAMAERLPGICFEALAAVPYAGLAIGLAVSLESKRPLIYIREDEERETEWVIEGLSRPGHAVVVVNDVIIAGGRTIAAIEALRDAGLVVRDVVVLLDSEQGGTKRLAAHGVTLHSVFTMSALVEILADRGKISEATRVHILRALGRR